MKMKRKNHESFFKECLQNYIRNRIGSSYQSLGISEDTMVFFLGALTYPKEMLKAYKNKSKDVHNIIKVYNYLYKFSLERL